MVIRMNIKEKRMELKMSQEELAKIIGVSSRTIRRYENGQIDRFKREYILNILNDMSRIDEEYGILEHDEIVKVVSEVASKYDVDFIYLFGSYSTNKADDTSDVDLLIKTNEEGLDYFGLIEDLRVSLKKKVDLINVNELKDNQELLIGILRDGKKIYG